MGFEENIHDLLNDAIEYIIYHIVPFGAALVCMYIVYIILPRLSGLVIMTLPIAYVHDGILVQNTLYLIIGFVGFILSLSCLGLEVSSLITGYGIFTSAMGFGLVDIIRESLASITITSKIHYDQHVIICPAGNVQVEGEFLESSCSLYTMVRNRSTKTITIMPNSAISNAILVYPDTILQPDTHKRNR